MALVTFVACGIATSRTGLAAIRTGTTLVCSSGWSSLTSSIGSKSVRMTGGVLYSNPARHLL